MVYEFVCPEGHVEAIHMSLDAYSKSIELDGKFICQECGATMRRKFSPPAISIK